MTSSMATGTMRSSLIAHVIDQVISRQFLSTTLGGPIEMPTVGVSVTVAVAVLVESATLVAVTVTNCWPETVAGAVYSPLVVMLPTLGAIDQFTAELLVPVTVAPNCRLCPAVSVAVGGLTEMPTVGLSVTIALADLVESATLVANTVTTCWLEMVAGAV